MDLIQVLSVVFSLSPEVCEEHLVQSGWTGFYNDSEVPDWNSRRIAREHVSVKWHRPSRISLTTLEETSLDIPSDQILSHKRRTISSRGKDGEPDEFRDVKIHPTSNIWRRHLDFRLFPEGALRENDMVTCEERATLWQRYEDDCLFGTLGLEEFYLQKSKVFWSQS